MEEVINNVRELFIDEGYDEQVLQELKHTWERKLDETKVVAPTGKDNDQSQSTAPVSGRKQTAAQRKAAQQAQQQSQPAAASQSHAHDNPPAHHPPAQTMNVQSMLRQNMVQQQPQQQAAPTQHIPPGSVIVDQVRCDALLRNAYKSS